MLNFSTVSFLLPSTIKTRSSEVPLCCLRLLSQHVTSGPATAASNAVLETVTFCRGYLKINNSAVEQYFQTKFSGSFTDIFRINCI